MADTDYLDAFGWLADNAGCGHLRIELPLTTMRAHGYRTGWSGLLHETTILRCRTLIGQRVCLPAATDRWQRIARATERPKLVYEMDDNLFDVDHTNQTSAFFGQPHIRDNIGANIRVADAVTVTTERLAEVARRYTTAPVHVIPNYLPAALLDHAPPRRGDRVTIGWAGSQTHEMDFEQLRQPLRRYLERAPRNVEFHVMGADYARWMKLPAERCRFTPWVDGPEEFWRSIDFHIAVMPLRPHVFNQAKSWIKALEAAFLGVPVVASDVGPYPDFVHHGETGYLVRRDHEWGRYLRALVEDEAMRTEMGANARRQAACHTIEGNVNAWKQVLA